jgi:hypothetical protein
LFISDIPTFFVVVFLLLDVINKPNILSCLEALEQIHQ